MSRPTRCFRIRVVIFAVISCCIMVVPVALLAFPLLDRYHETPPPAATITTDFSVGPADWRELYWHKNKSAPSREASAQTDLSPEDLYDLVAPSVVTIIVKDENEEPIASGSGFFVDEALLGERYEWLHSDKTGERVGNETGSPTQHGYVLTNHHVIRPAVYADVLLFNGDKGTVSHVVGEDEIADLALLSVSVSSERPLQPIPLAASNPRILSTVYAIGSPEGLEGTASQGEVSAYRALNGNGHWLQTTAPISHGSSGGPLVSPQGELVGVTTLRHKEGQNLNFAVPASIIRSFFLATNFNLRRRDVAEGASIRWDEDMAFFMLDCKSKFSTSFSPTEKHGIDLLLEARKARPVKEGVAECYRVITMAEEANTLLPDDLKYLAYFIAGEAHVWASAYEVGATRLVYTTEHRARLKTNKHAIEAYYHLLEALELRPDFSPTYDSLFFLHRMCGDWADALLTADDLVKIMPRCATALASRASCYVELDLLESAQDDYLSAIDLSPRSGSLHYQLAFVIIKLGDYAKAITSFATAIKLFDNSNDPVTQRLSDDAQYRMGILYRKVGNFQKAISILTLARKNDWPSDDMCDAEIAKCKRLER